MRWRPLDESHLTSLKQSDLSYTGLAMAWGLYSECIWLDPHVVLWQIVYRSTSWSTLDSLTMWVSLNTTQSTMNTPVTIAENMYYSDQWWFSGLLYDSIWGVWVINGSLTWTTQVITWQSASVMIWWSTTSTSSKTTSILIPTPNQSDPSHDHSIQDGVCFTRKKNMVIQDSITNPASQEFKQSLEFMHAFDMTMYDSVDAYEPTKLLTRQQTAKIVSNFAINVLCRKPNTSLVPWFKDVDGSDPTLQPYITLSYQLGLMKWSEDKYFRPFDMITKAELNAILIRLILWSYLPEQWSRWHDRYDELSLKLGIMKYNNPWQKISREYAALMMYRTYNNQKFVLRTIDYNTGYVLDSRDEILQWQ
jgi:S-layer homology domain